jgi:DNA-binding CsgD family transcriptional regulator
MTSRRNIIRFFQGSKNFLARGEARMLREFLLQKGLSNREVEVAELVSKGMANKEVADRLFVTEKTVKFHLTNIYKKMAIKSRSQLIVWCLPHLRMQEEDEAAQQSQINTAQAANSINQNLGGNDLIAGNGNRQSTTTNTGSSYDIRTEELPNGIKTFNK